MMTRNERQRGSALLETPIFLLVFLITVIETLDIGQVMFFQAMLLDRARAGARYAVTASYDPNVIANVIAYNNPAGGSGAGVFGLQTSMVSVNRYDAGASSDRVEITIQNYPLAFYGPLLACSFTSRVFRVTIPVQGMGATG